MVVALAAPGGALGEMAAVRHRTCPSEDRQFVPSADPATRTTMVPGHPIGVLVCRYWGAPDAQPRYTLAGERYVAGSPKLLAFARKLNALEPIPTAPAPSCPVFGGRSVLLFFRYNDEPDTPVRIVRQGCIPVSNGHLRNRYGLSLPLGKHWPDERAI